jgi:hypothetical protein
LPYPKRHAEEEMTMRNAHLGNPISVRLTQAVFAALTVAVLGLAGASQAQAQSGASSSKEQRFTIDISGSQQFNECVAENVTITRGKDQIRTQTQERPGGGVVLRTRDHAEGEGLGDTGARYNYLEDFDTRTESTETVFKLRLEHRRHLIRHRNDLPNDDSFLRSELRLTTDANGVTDVQKNDLRVECR